MLFAVGLLATGVASVILTGGLPSVTSLRQGEPLNFVGGVIVGFYVLSITMLAPRFGVGNAILFVMTAQIFTSAAIDHFGLFGAAVRPANSAHVGGLVLLLVGLALSQLAAQRTPMAN